MEENGFDISAVYKNIITNIERIGLHDLRSSHEYESAFIIDGECSYEERMTIGKLKLALEYIAKAEDVKVEDSQIDEKIDELSKQYGSDNADSLKKNESVRKYMSEKILQDNTLKVIIDNVVVK